jgi:eukaryotic-like serine/threonine-protein kinase
VTDRETWRRARTLFDAALALPESGRSAWVRSEAADDLELLEEVLGLLEAYREDDDFLEKPAGLAAGPPGEVAPAASSEAPRAGAMVGTYRLLREVGSGGMGVVWEAERADELYTRRVAIKFIKLGMDTEAVLRRFRREREILARLEHPNIAGLLDAGVTDDGRPWFAMEYVDGRPITEFCRRGNLPVGERLRLMRDACAAVHFAHRSLVLHRDLKPSNLLVTPDGTVKLLDFGVARILDPEPTDEPELTRLGAGRPLTPAYASPEQIAGAPLTTATDVYALGVILYEMLAGRRPFGDDRASVEEVVQEIREGRPLPPSEVALTSTERGRPGEALGALPTPDLGSELDHIVLMAIRPEPERRYASAAQFAEDLRRHEEGYPVLAQPDSTGYRVRKFVGRNRVAVAAAAAALTALVAGGGVAAWQAGVAERERALAEARAGELREITTTLLFDVHDAIAQLPGATAAREIVVARAFDHLGRLAESAPGDPDLSLDVARGYLRLATVLGNPTGASLGDRTGALEAVAEGLAVTNGLHVSGPDEPAVLGVSAELLRRKGDLLAWEGDVRGGVQALEASLEQYIARLGLSGAADETAHLEVVIAHNKLGDLTGHPVFPNLGDPDGAIGHYENARALLEAPPLSGSQVWSVRRFRGLVDERLGAMYRFLGDPDRAHPAFRRSLEAREALALEDPDNLNALRDVAIGHQLLCGVQSELGRPEEGLPDCRTAVDLFRDLHARDPENRQAAVDLAIMEASLASVLEEVGDRSGAHLALLGAIRTRETILERDPGNAVNPVVLDGLRHEAARLSGG